MTIKHYRVDFYQINIKPTADIPTPSAGFDAIRAGLCADRALHNGVTREMWKLQTDKPGVPHIFGQLRKFRKEDLPEIGAAGADGRAIELADNEGLIEKNFFIFFHQHDLLAWHVNGHGSTPGQLGRVLSDLWDCNVSIDPVIGSESLRRLMSPNATIKSLEVSIPRPTNANIYADSDFSRSSLQMLSDSAGDNLKLRLSIDGRRADSAGGLVDDWKIAIRDFLRNDARTAKATIIEGNLESPIDLIADRVQSTQEVDTDAKYPAASVMHDQIMAARDECSDAITAYFGDGEGVLD